ncbi:MAG: hypothetical protein GX446_12335 [Chthonomonadales bacterium]|nr:hypothetical protein [Chthonomonadales bacterium]
MLRLVRPRAYAVGIALVLLNQFWLVEVELVRWSLFTNAVPFCNAIFTLACVIGVNGALGRGRLTRSFVLTRPELLCVFTMTCVGAALGAQQMGQLLVSFLPFPFQYAGVGNRWHTSFMPYLPRRFMMDDPKAVAAFYAGNSSLYRPENWIPWLVPVGIWVSFIVVLVYTMLCMTTLLRRRWMVSERLTYPTVYLPMEMTSGAPFWANRGMWLGFALAGGITLTNGIAFFWPSVPMVPIKRQDIDPYITSPPWIGMGNVKVSFYFFAIGLAFLMPLDLSFSLWFFYVLYKLELVAVTALGIEQSFSSGAGFSNFPPYEHGQAFGAYMAVAAMALWAARRDLADIARRALGRCPDAGDGEEPMRYRTALVGMILGILALAGFCVLMGMSPWVAVAFFALYFILVVVITRIRAEFGFPIHDMHYMGPLNPLLATMGTSGLGPRNLTGFALTYWFNRTYFANPAPHLLEGMKLAETSEAQQRSFARGIMLAACVGAVGLFWAYLNKAYDLGAGTANVERWPREFPGENFSRLHGWFTTPGTPNFGSLVAAGVSFLLSLGMAALRQRVAWFPLHPLGYAVANSWGMAQIWLPVLIGCTFKAATMRYGGLRVYRRAVPVFLGLILGEMVIGCVWTLYGIAMGIRAYDFWP